MTESAWQPIETAPKDGRPFLAWHEGWSCVCLIRFLKTYHPSPTHWMPLPQPPANDNPSSLASSEFVLSLEPLLNVRPNFQEVFIPRLNGGMAVCLSCGAFDDQIMIREHRSDCQSKAEFAALDRLKAAIEVLRSTPETAPASSPQTSRDATASADSIEGEGR